LFFSLVDVDQVDELQELVRTGVVEMLRTQSLRHPIFAYRLNSAAIEGGKVVSE